MTRSSSVPKGTTNSKSTSKLDPKRSDMVRFVRRLHGQAPAWFLRYRKNQAGGSRDRLPSQQFGTTRQVLNKLIESNRKGYNISVAVNKFASSSRLSANVKTITAAFIDVDNGHTTHADLKKLKLKPNIIVRTSARRLHAYWLLKDCSVEEFKPIQQAMIKRFDSDAAVVDHARVMRLPGSINWKRRTPVLSRLVHSDNRLPVTVKALKRKLGLVIEKPTTSTPQSSGSTHGTGNGDQHHKLSSTTVTKIRSALKRIKSDNRADWLRVAMAIHSAAPNQQGYDLWTKWSKLSGKFHEKTQQKTWDGLKSGRSITIGSLFWMAGRPARDRSMDDMDAAQLFAKTFRPKLRFDPQRSLWYTFNGVAWRVDKQAPMRAARQLVDDLSAGEGKKDPSITRLRTHAGMRAMVNVAELESRLHISETAFDHNVDLLAAKNGLIDLPTGKFRPAKANDFLRRCADVEFDADAKAPLWRKFVQDITCGDKELARFLQRAVGYTLFGHIKAQVFFVCEGTGENGKGVFMRTLATVFGDYATVLAPNIVTSAFAGTANQSAPALMALVDKRLAIVTELPEGKRFDTAFVKLFAGGDSIAARANYGEMTTFKPEGKLWLSTNDIPDIRANDKAMWRRILPIPFNGNFSGADRDDHIEERLASERAGILNWALQGARRYHQAGKLESCPAVEEKKRTMRKESDTLGSWVKESCVVGKGKDVQASKAYGSYCEYTKGLRRDPLTQKAFHVRMEEMGYARRKGKKFNSYLGLALRPTAGGF